MLNRIMHEIAIVVASLLLSTPNTWVFAMKFDSNTTDVVPTWTAIPPCDALVEAGFREKLLFPSDDGYAPQIDSWWSLNARLHPWCLLLPQNTQELAQIVTVLNNTGQGAGDWHIAIRSGGHNQRGFNNIVNGITIDLSYMNHSSYDTTTNLAKIEPGARWQNVYADLLKWNVTVPGGRDGDVGVGGFLLGGGNTFFMGRRGFGCDSISNYEVILANGSIINANKNENADLWKALKGGGPNFGIVTRYDIDALPAVDLSYSLKTMSLNQSDQVLTILNKFTDLGASDGANDALVVFYSNLEPQIPVLTVSTISVNTMGQASSNFKHLRELPAIKDDASSRSMAAAAAGSKVPGGTSIAQFAIAFRNEMPILKYAADQHKRFFDDMTTLIGTGNFTTYMFLQPLASYYNDISKQRGGNMLGLDRTDDNAIMWVGAVTVNETVPQTVVAAAHQAVGSMTAELRTKAQQMGYDLPLEYMNYADAAQDPLGSYGTENVEFIREVAQRYDPEGFFQMRVPGGFKIARVR